MTSRSALRAIAGAALIVGGLTGLVSTAVFVVAYLTQPGLLGRLPIEYAAEPWIAVGWALFACGVAGMLFWRLAEHRGTRDDENRPRASEPFERVLRVGGISLLVIGVLVCIGGYIDATVAAAASAARFARSSVGLTLAEFDATHPGHNLMWVGITLAVVGVSAMVTAFGPATSGRPHDSRSVSK
jgi:hypothetical protein